MSALCKCGAETSTGIFLCHACSTRLEQLLCELDSIVEDLVSAIPRASLTANYGERVASSGSLHAPLPINDTALDAKIALDKYLMRTCLELAKVAGPLSRRDSSGLASYLLTHMGSLRTQEWAGDVEGELGKLLKKCQQANQPIGERINVGACGSVFNEVTCDNPLNPLKNQESIRCRVCGTTWDVRERQRDAIGAAWTHSATPPVIMRALAEYGMYIRPDSFKNWVKLGHLAPVGDTSPKEYRVNEVWAVAKRMAERRKASKQAAGL
jgi:hypothetical protein